MRRASDQYHSSEKYHLGMYDVDFVGVVELVGSDTVVDRHALWTARVTQDLLATVQQNGVILDLPELPLLARHEAGVTATDTTIEGIPLELP